MDYKYTSVDEDSRGRSSLWRKEVVGALLIAALSSMATFGVMTTFGVKTTFDVTTSAKVDMPHQFSCGESFDEAHQRGCTFDALTRSWLHPKCSLYGQQEFKESSKNSSTGSWQYWEDMGGLHHIGNYEALSYLPAGSTYWMTQEEHFHHCMWMLLRIHDAATTPGKRLDSRTSSPEHTMHCLEMLVEYASIGAGEKLSQTIVKAFTLDIGWSAC